MQPEYNRRHIAIVAALLLLSLAGGMLQHAFQTPARIDRQATGVLNSIPAPRRPRSPYPLNRPLEAPSAQITSQQSAASLFFNCRNLTNKIESSITVARGDVQFRRRQSWGFLMESLTVQLEKSSESLEGKFKELLDQHALSGSSSVNTAYSYAWLRAQASALHRDTQQLSFITQSWSQAQDDIVLNAQYAANATVTLERIKQEMQQIAPWATRTSQP